MVAPSDKTLHVELTRSILDSAIRVQDALVGVEAKTVERLTALHQAQVITYLRLSDKEVGLRLNFWASPLKDGGIQRLIRIPRARVEQSIP